jgi:hypothetical protein
MRSTPNARAVMTDPPPVVRKDIYARRSIKYPRPIALQNMLDLNNMYSTISGTFIIMVRRIDEFKAVCFISHETNYMISQQALMNSTPIDVLYDEQGLVYSDATGSPCRIDYIDCHIVRSDIVRD